MAEFSMYSLVPLSGIHGILLFLKLPQMAILNGTCCYDSVCTDVGPGTPGGHLFHIDGG